MLAGKGVPLVRHLAQVQAVAQHREEALLVEDLAFVPAPVLRDPHLGGVALDLQLAHQLCGRSGLGVAREDVPHQRRLPLVDDQLAVPDVIPQGRCAAQPALFTAVNADTMEIYAELVPFDAALAQRMSDRAARVISATEAGELLPRSFAESTHFECKVCLWTDRCWSPQP